MGKPLWYRCQKETTENTWRRWSFWPQSQSAETILGKEDIMIWGQADYSPPTRQFSPFSCCKSCPKKLVKSSCAYKDLFFVCYRMWISTYVKGCEHFIASRKSFPNLFWAIWLRTCAGFMLHSVKEVKIHSGLFSRSAINLTVHSSVSLNETRRCVCVQKDVRCL